MENCLSNNFASFPPVSKSSTEETEKRFFSGDWEARRVKGAIRNKKSAPLSFEKIQNLNKQMTKKTILSCYRKESLEDVPFCRQFLYWHLFLFMLYLTCDINLNIWLISYKYVFFLLVKMHALFSHTCMRCRDLCRSKTSYAFFVRGFGCALFYLKFWRYEYESRNANYNW